MSSTAALAGHPWTAAYSASKGGILALTYTLAIEYCGQGLRANAVCPARSRPHPPFSAAGERLKLLPDRTARVFRGEAAAWIAFLDSDDAAHIILTGSGSTAGPLLIRRVSSRGRQRADRSEGFMQTRARVAVPAAERLVHGRFREVAPGGRALRYFGNLVLSH
jgi:hypothetical protein